MDLTGLIVGDGHPLLLFGIAFVLGALHALEPGHAKTMIAAFIVAVRGTALQAVVLGLSATVAHSAIVWLLAAAALASGDTLVAETAEPYLMVASGAIVLVIAAWMFGRVQGERAMQPVWAGADGHHHGHGHDRGPWHEADGATGADRGDSPASVEGGDAHARAHAAALRERLAAGGGIGLRQTVLFGLTGGLIPCAAAVTVLLVCLQLDSVWLGVGLVGGFSLGLGATLVMVGVAAAWGTAAAARRAGGLVSSGRLERWSGRLPYLSALLIGTVGAAMMAAGLSHLPAG